MLRKESHTSHVLKSGSENAKCHTLNGKPIQNIVPSNSGDDGANDWKNVIGKPVCISGVKEGILQYYGRTQFADGLWCGVELKEPVGKNDGTVNGVRYFTCLPNHGIFAPVTKVTVLPQLKSSGNTLTEDQNFYRRDEGKAEVPEACKNVCYLKQSSSDPTFQKTNIKCFCPNCRCDTSFGDKRCFTEQRELNIPLLDRKTCESTFEFLPFGKLKTSSTSSSTNLFEKRHSISNLRQFHYSNGKQELLTYGPKGTLEQVFNCTVQNNNTATTCLESASIIENISKESLTGFTVAAKPERPLLRFEGQGLSSKRCIDAYQSESKYRIPSSDSLETKDDDDDQLSLDYDESLGILSPSQMKDFTLCGDLSTSCSEIARAVDFPSSESFDDVNDLPEDEIAHDVSIQFMASGPTSIVTSVTVSQSNIADSVKMQHMLRELKQNISPKPMLSCTEQFLLNVSSDSISDVHFEPCPVDSALNKNSVFPENKTETNEKNINVSQANSIPSDPESSTPEILDTSQNEGSVLKESQNAWFNSYSQPASRKVESFPNQEFYDYSYEEKFDYSHKQKPEQLFTDQETDGEKHSHFSSSTEHLVSKEKVSVSWEEGTVHSPDKISSKVERPESVYTVSSCDTGYQEEGEEEDIDAVMTISTESAKENKKSSVTSRDSGVIMDDIDALKAVESASTSGYSTGLSDSYYNDRPEEEGSRPFMEDSFRDVHDSYHSDDGLIDPPMSVSMDESVGAVPEKTGGFFDMDSYKEGDVNTEFQITESNTMLGLDSTCKSFVEDDTCFDRSANGSVTSQHNETVITKENSSSGNEAKAFETKKKSPVPDKTSQNSTESFQQSSSGRKDKDAQSPIGSKVNKTQMLCENSVKSDDTKKQLLKSPKRKVMCRIKAAIENSANRVSNKKKPEVGEQDNVKVVATKKKSRWESVTSKIAASLAEDKTKLKPKKDVKSKVDTNLAAARQACRSPKLEQSSNTSEKSLDYSLSSPTSSRSRRTHPESYRDTDGRNIHVARVDRSPQSPRHMQRLLSLMAGCAPVCRMAYVIHTPPGPGKACLSSRSVSPVAASESSTTSHTASSHHSRSKIAVWKGSNNAVAPPLVSPQVKKPFMGTAFKLISRVNRIQNKDIAKEKQVHNVPVETVVTSTGVKTTRTPAAKLDTTPKPYCSKFKTAKDACKLLRIWNSNF